MPQAAIEHRLKAHFPELIKHPADSLTRLFSLIQVPAHTRVFDVHSPCEYYLLLTEGLISVKMRSRSGKAIMLYKVEPGQSCIVTTSCLLGNTVYPTFAEADTDIEAISLPARAFKQALDQSDAFRSFVFKSLGQRLADVMQRLEAVNFTSIDHRLAESLLRAAGNNDEANLTHEQLAEEIGSAREVVSRHLKKLESQQLIQLARGAIHILDVAGLNALIDT